MSVYATSIRDLSYPVKSETSVKDESYFSTPISFETEDPEAFLADDGCFLNPPSLPTPSTPDEEASQPLTLTPEQQQVLEHVRAGKVDHLNSIFVCIGHLRAFLLIDTCTDFHLALCQ